MFTLGNRNYKIVIEKDAENQFFVSGAAWSDTAISALSEIGNVSGMDTATGTMRGLGQTYLQAEYFGSVDANGCMAIVELATRYHEKAKYPTFQVG